MPRVVILDYGFGNLRSAERALHQVGAEVTVTSGVAESLRADGLVVPGVGAFSACMNGLLAVGGDKIVEARRAQELPTLGICVGMQIFFERGLEHGTTTAGLGQWPGTVDRLTADVLPHMGWNTVRPTDRSGLFAGIAADARFYFVHSYAVRSRDSSGIAAKSVKPTWAHHGEDFLAAVEDGPLTATQFHPEKSGDTGLRLLANWVATL